MAKTRMIRPEFFSSETVAGLPPAARLTFVGMWTEADDWGNLPDKPLVLKGHLWPFDEGVTGADVAEHIRLMVEAGLVDRYEVGGRRFLRMRNWDEHQKMPRRSSRWWPASPSEPLPDPSDPVDNLPLQEDAVHCSALQEDAVQFSASPPLNDAGAVQCSAHSNSNSNSSRSLSPLAVGEKSSSSSGLAGPLSRGVIHRDLAEQRDDDDDDFPRNQNHHRTDTEDLPTGLDLLGAITGPPPSPGSKDPRVDRALTTVATLLARRYATEGKEAGYRATVLAKPHEHLIPLRVIAETHPHEDPDELAARYLASRESAPAPKVQARCGLCGGAAHAVSGGCATGSA